MIHATNDYSIYSIEELRKAVKENPNLLKKEAQQLNKNFVMVKN